MQTRGEEDGVYNTYKDKKEILPIQLPILTFLKEKRNKRNLANGKAGRSISLRVSLWNTISDPCHLHEDTAKRTCRGDGRDGFTIINTAGLQQLPLAVLHNY